MSSCRTLEGLNERMCKRLHTLLVVQKMQCGQKNPMELAIIWADRAPRFDTLRGAPGRPSTSAIRTASIFHHRPSAFRTLRTMPAESVGLALPAAGRFQ